MAKTRMTTIDAQAHAFGAILEGDVGDVDLPVLCGGVPIDFQVVAFETCPADLFGEEAVLDRVIDVLEELPIDPPIDGRGDPVGVHKQNGDPRLVCDGTRRGRGGKAM